MAAGVARGGGGDCRADPTPVGLLPGYWGA